MTAVLQVLDLAVNGPIKAYTRAMRAKRLVAYFPIYREEYRMWKDADNEGDPPFTGPRPDLSQSMSDIIKLFATNFEEESFKESIARCFQRTGCYHDNSDAKVFERFSWGNHNWKSRSKTEMPVEEFELLTAVQEGSDEVE